MPRIAWRAADGSFGGRPVWSIRIALKALYPCGMVDHCRKRRVFCGPRPVALVACAESSRVGQGYGVGRRKAWACLLTAAAPAGRAAALRSSRWLRQSCPAGFHPITPSRRRRCALRLRGLRPETDPRRGAGWGRSLRGTTAPLCTAFSSLACSLSSPEFADCASLRFLPCKGFASPGSSAQFGTPMLSVPRIQLGPLLPFTFRSSLRRPPDPAGLRRSPDWRQQPRSTSPAIPAVHDRANDSSRLGQHIKPAPSGDSVIMMINHRCVQK